MKKTLMFATIASMVLASCSNDDAFVTSHNQLSKNELGISAGIVGLNGVQTKAIKTGKEFSANESISVFIAGDNYTSAVSIYTNSSKLEPWTADNKIFVSDKLATAYGFYPSTIETKNVDYANKKVAITVPATDDFSASAATDYMYATPIANLSNAGTNTNMATLAFHHALSQLSFVVNCSENYGAGETKLNAIKLTSSNEANFFKNGAATMSLVNGELSFTGTPVAALSFAGAATLNAYAATSSTNVIAQALVAPIAALSNDIVLTLTIGTKVMSVALPVVSPAAAAWKAGENYTYTITVTGSELVINKAVTITDWAPVKGGDMIVK